MEKFTRVTGAACPIGQVNLNTDQILPARYLKWTRAMGIGKVLFQDLRFDADGKEKPDVPINKPAWRDAKVVVGARNFGCGSSREAAVYALYDYGVRCVIAPSFGDIFSGNAVQNGLLTAIVTDEDAAELRAALEQTPELPVTVDLEQQTIVCGNRSYKFNIDPVRRMRLLNGWDDIALTQSYRDRIAAFKTQDQAARLGASGGAGLIGVVSVLRSGFLLSCARRAHAGDEVLRTCGEILSSARSRGTQRRCEAGIGEPFAQQRNDGFVLGAGMPRRCSLQAGIAEEAMNGFAHQLTDFEIVEKTQIAVSRRGRLRHVPRGAVVVGQVAGERDVTPRFLGHRVQAAVAHRVTVGLEAARKLRLGEFDIHPRNVAEVAVLPRLDAAAVPTYLRHLTGHLAKGIVCRG